MASGRCITNLSSSCRRLASLSPARWRPMAFSPSRRVQPRHIARRQVSTSMSTSLARDIATAIEQTGPISLAHYMRQCLTGVDRGYYVASPDPFGEEGDFVTSPEISQMFGEMIGIWIVAEWLAQDMCGGKPVNLIELGPGRGTLMDDILRTIRRFPELASRVSGVRMVEASPALRDVQCTRLCGEDHKPEWESDTWTGMTKYLKTPITWYEDIRQIPITDAEAPFFIAHEFFDALPIHAFQNTKEGWRELLVDVKPSASNLILTTSELPSKDPEFCFALSKSQTTHARLLNSLSPRFQALSQTPDAMVEFSPDAHSYILQFCRSIHEAASGGALVIDYGPADTIPVNSLRGIQKHKRVSPFVQPGLVDISADVDFGALVESALQPNLNVEVHGPAEQGQFLLSIGMRERYEMLVQTTTDPDQLAVLKTGFERLTEGGGLGMGKIYKALAIVPEAGGRPVAGFPQLHQPQDVEAEPSNEAPVP